MGDGQEEAFLRALRAHEREKQDAKKAKEDARAMQVARAHLYACCMMLALIASLLALAPFLASKLGDPSKPRTWQTPTPTPTRSASPAQPMEPTKPPPPPPANETPLEKLDRLQREEEEAKRQRPGSDFEPMKPVR